MTVQDAVDDNETKVADENGSAELLVSDFPQPEPRKSHFAEMLKAIEHWVQTR